MGALDSNDIENASGVLSWNDGENTSKTIELQILGDSLEEINESFMVRLFDPKNGAALGKHNMAIVSVIDKATADVEISAGEDQIVNAGDIVQLQGILTGANSDEITYEWTQSSGNSVQIAQDGDGTAEFVAPSSAGILQFSFTASISNGGSYSDQTNVTIVVGNNFGTSSGGGGCTVSTNTSNQPLLLFLILIFSIVFITNKKYAYIRIAKK